jgi:hypothetical protein
MPSAASSCVCSVRESPASANLRRLADADGIELATDRVDHRLQTAGLR